MSRKRGIDAVAEVMGKVFRMQKMQAQADKERFGDWNRRLASMLEAAVIQLYREAAKSAKAKQASADDFDALARERAIRSAREINETTATWLQEGRDLSAIFGPSRIAAIAATEAVFAQSAGEMIVSKESDGMLEWVCGRKPCKWCRERQGKRIKAGKSFGSHEGVAVYHPPAHPHCYCKVRRV